VPKIKTKRAAAKRFKKTASGKFKRGQSNKRHILTKKKRSRKNKLKKTDYVSKADMALVTRCLPNNL